MSTPKFTPFIMLLQFLLSSAACYIVLLNHLEDYQQLHLTTRQRAGAGPWRSRPI